METAVNRGMLTNETELVVANYEYTVTDVHVSSPPGIEDTPEQAQDDCALSNFDYEPDTFRKFFTTPFDQYKEHVGKAFTVLGHDTEAEQQVVDDGGEFEEMYRIRLEDGTEITAWGHEVCVLKYDKCH